MNAAVPLPSRIVDLVARFRVIAEERMRGLPICNERLEVEATGFRPFAGGWIGVLVTPWTMNVLMLPAEVEPWRPAEAGRRLRIILPSGEHEFLTGGDEVVGAWRSRSLYSPVTCFGDPAAARAAGLAALEKLMTPAVPQAGAPDPAGPALDRRQVLRGTFRGT
jgi:[NiFe] hydrogenase assembly HybE family chaperone